MKKQIENCYYCHLPCDIEKDCADGGRTGMIHMACYELAKYESMSTEQIYSKALSTYGKPAQMMVAIEECSELIKALCKHGRNPTDLQAIENIVDELADVSIMVAQMSIIFDENAVNERIEFKNNRLKDRLFKNQ